MYYIIVCMYVYIVYKHTYTHVGAYIWIGQIVSFLLKRERNENRQKVHLQNHVSPRMQLPSPN